ncbi:MAG: hypothetical protein ACFCD0_12285 [Gemmataceae bacterium]
MLHYPKIPSTKNCPGGRCIAFEKYDGTNMHWDWDRDFGWHAFGTRRDTFNLTDDGIDLFAEKHPQQVECVEVFWETLAPSVDESFRKNPNYQEFQELKIFTEFLGTNSFAGAHKPDDPKELVLFDVEAEGFGIIGPDQFVDDFGHLRSARVIYRGKFTGKFIEDVRNGKYDVFEGVVCKGGKGGDDLWMAKIKTNAYQEQLKEAFQKNWEAYWE